MKELPLNKVSDAVQQAWSLKTSNDPEWSADNPALGQCAVTACVVQDYLGGDILSSVVTFPDGRTGSHYFNVIDGKIVDLTRQQFPADAVVSDGQPKTKGFASTREYCLSFDATQQRYRLLKESTEEQLDG